MCTYNALGTEMESIRCNSPGTLLCEIMPVNVSKSIQQKVKVKTDFVLMVHILSEMTRDETTS